MNNATVATGLWTYALSTLTGFTVGGNYRYLVTASLASAAQMGRFVYGSAEGDLTVNTDGSVTIHPIKNTSLSAFEFVMYDSATHALPTTGLTVTAQRSIDGAAYANCANAVAEVGSGTYKIDLAAADLNGNVITLKFTATGADTQFVTITT